MPRSNQTVMMELKEITPGTLGAARSDLMVIRNVAPQIFNHAEQCLRIFKKSSANVAIQRSPIMQFCLEEVVNSAIHLHECIIKRKLTYFIIRDILDNLLRMQKYAMKNYPHEIEELGVALERIFSAIGQLATVLAKMKEVPLPDLLVLTSQMRTNCKPPPENEQPSCANYVPDWRDITKLCFLGRGGFGRVYKVLYRPASLTCALKIIPREILDDSRQSYVDKMVVSILNNPFLVNYYASYRSENSYITIMELLEGIEVKTFVDRKRFLDPEETTVITAQAYLAIEHLHLRGFVHRDIKQNNMVIMPGGRVKLFDYELCKACLPYYLRRQFPFYFSLTASEFVDDSMCGSLPFISPEVLSIPNATYGRATDLWSLGVCVFRMVNGKTPFRSYDDEELKELIKHDQPEWRNVQDLTAPVWSDTVQLIHQLLEKVPQRRLGSGSYEEVRNHSFFARTDLEALLKNNTGKVLESVFLDDLLRETRQMTPISEAPCFENDRVTILFDDVIEMQDDSNHWPLYTYISAPFKALIRNIKTKQTSDVLFSPPSPLVDFSSNIDPQAVLHNPSLDMVRLPQTDITVSIEANRERKCFSNKFAFTLVTVPGAFSNHYHMVDHIKGGTKAAASNLVYGDIVTSIDGKNIMGLEHRLVEKIINSSTEDSLTLTVFAANPFRTTYSNDKMVSSLKNQQPVEVVLKRLEKSKHPGVNSFGFQVSKCQSFDAETGEFATLYLINKLDPDIAHESEMQLFVGDVVRQVNETIVFDGPKVKFKNCLPKPPQDTIVIYIHPVSVLRLIPRAAIQ